MLDVVGDQRHKDNAIKGIEFIYNYPLFHTSIWGLIIGWFFVLEGFGLVAPIAIQSLCLYVVTTILFYFLHLYVYVLIFNTFLIRPFIRLCAKNNIDLSTLNIGECDLSFGVVV